MICTACYKKHTAEGYCYSCRKKLFGGGRVPAILGFEQPKAENLDEYQQQTKRLSISGVQLKYSLRLEKNKLVLTDRGGQYILKPIPPSRQITATGQAPENEHLTMQIAEQVYGIRTAGNALIYFSDGAPAYITKRFDVTPDGSKRQQEDMCQILGRNRQSHGEHFKYNGNYLEIAEMIRKYVAAYPAAIENLFRQVLFNYLFSNGDAHLKNFSLLRADSGDYLDSPAYDIMSTVLHSPLEADTALDLYENSSDGPYHSVYGCYGQPEFRIMAGRAGMKPLRIERLLTQLLSNTEKVIAMIGKSFLRDDIKARYHENYIKRLSRMTL